jgi:hypothetical protein
MCKAIMLSAPVLGCAALLALAQSGGPAAFKESSVKMSGKTISVRYAAPSLPGAKVFGAAVPYNKVWLVGGQPIQFHTEAGLEVQGMAVPKGTYSLYILPDPKEWQLIINKQTGPQAANYTAKMDLGRVPMDMKKAPSPVDPLRVSLVSYGSVAGKLEIAWENVIASVPFNLDVVQANPEW